MPCRNSVFGCKYIGLEATHAAICGSYACLWRNNGCAFTGTKAAIGMHERACDYAVVYCLLREKGCQFICQRRDLPRHFAMCIRQTELEHTLNTKNFIPPLRSSDDKKPAHIPSPTPRMAAFNNTNITTAESTTTPTNKNNSNRIHNKDKKNRVEVCAQQIVDDKMVILNVGGHEIATSVRLLCRYPSSVLGALGARARKSEQRPVRLFLDRDFAVIENVLTFLRYGRLPPGLTVQEHTLLLWEAEYLALPELTRMLKAHPPVENLLPIYVELDVQGLGVVVRSLL